jgi:hypothetical protein
VGKIQTFIMAAILSMGVEPSWLNYLLNILENTFTMIIKFQHEFPRRQTFKPLHTLLFCTSSENLRQSHISYPIKLVYPYLSCCYTYLAFWLSMIM